MTKIEYIWLDGNEPQQLRSKTKVLEEFSGNLVDCPIWGFDGSSTNQAPGDNSDCVLKPIRLYENPLDEQHNSYLVMCEVWNVDDTPHKTNNRFELEEMCVKHSEKEPWFGMEQEYTLFKNDRPLGWPEDGSVPPPQSDYYCGRNVGEDIVKQHMDACITADIKICGINSEVMLGQWEYQIGADNPLRVSDDVWVARWLMEKICAMYDIKVSLDPKPIAGDWNGAGCHTNFSTRLMRDKGLGIVSIHNAMDRFKEKHIEHILVYGRGNVKRLTGLHETCPIDKFRWGVSDRGASIRIPWQVEKEEGGYLEDRRPAANCDPYMVCWRILKTVCGD